MHSTPCRLAAELEFPRKSPARQVGPTPGILHGRQFVDPIKQFLRYFQSLK